MIKNSLQVNIEEIYAMCKIYVYIQTKLMHNRKFTYSIIYKIYRI